MLHNDIHYTDSRHAYIMTMSILILLPACLVSRSSCIETNFPVIKKLITTSICLLMPCVLRFTDNFVAALIKRNKSLIVADSAVLFTNKVSMSWKLISWNDCMVLHKVVHWFITEKPNAKFESYSGELYSVLNSAENIPTVRNYIRDLAYLMMYCDAKVLLIKG